MSLKRRDMPISSFDNRYLELLKLGCTQRVEVRQKSRKDAKRLVNLLTTFRARMRTEYKGKDDSRWEPLYGCIVSTSEDGFATVLRPRDKEAEHLLQDIRIGDANIDLGELGTPTSVEPAALVDDPLAEFEPDVPTTSETEQ